MNRSEIYHGQRVRFASGKPSGTYSVLSFSGETAVLQAPSGRWIGKIDLLEPELDVAEHPPLATDDREPSQPDLTDDELEAARALSGSHTTAHRMAVELQRHRAAERADAERIRQVVYEVAMDIDRTTYATVHIEKLNAIVNKAVEQLATATPVLSGEDRETFDRLRDSDGRTTARERAALDRLLGVRK